LCGVNSEIMALRNKIFLACESFLRVPPLIIVDEIFRFSFGLGYGAKFKQQNGAILTLTTEEPFFGSGEDGQDTSNNFTESFEEVLEDSMGLPYSKVRASSRFAWLESVMPTMDLSSIWNYVPSQLYSASETASASFESIVSSIPSSAGFFSQTGDSDANANPVAHMVQFGYGDFEYVKDVVTDDLFKLMEVVGCIFCKSSVQFHFIFLKNHREGIICVLIVARIVANKLRIRTTRTQIHSEDAQEITL